MSATTEAVTRAPRRQPKRITAELTLPPNESGKPSRKKLTASELATVATLHSKGLSVNGIAQVLNRHYDTIAANLKSSRTLLEAFAPDFTQDWKKASTVASTRGDHRPAMDALERLKVVERPKADVIPPIQIAIGIALPGLPQPPSPPSQAMDVIDVSESPRKA